MPTLEVRGPLGTVAPEGATAYRGGVLGNRTAFQREDGTWVNGDENVVRITKEDVWRNVCLPLLFLQERMHTERDGKRDSLILERKLRLTGTCRVHHLETPLTHHAHSQLASLASVPVAYYHTLMSRGHHVLAATCINTGIADRKLMDRYDPEGKFLLRFRHDHVRAVQTDTYGIYDNHQMLDDMVAALPIEMVPEIMCNSIWSDGDDVRFSYLVPDRWTQEPEDVWGIGIQCANSEIARSSLLVKPYVYSGTYDAGFSYDKFEASTGLIESRHYGKLTIRNRVRDALKNNMEKLLSSSQLLLVQLKRTRDVNVVNPAATITVLCRKHGMSQEQGRDWYSHARAMATWDTTGTTAHDLVLALALMAREKGTALRSELESKAGNILVPSLDAAPDRLVAYWMSVVGAAQEVQKRAPEMIADYTTGPVVPVVQAQLEV